MCPTEAIITRSASRPQSRTIEFMGGSRWRGAWKKGKPTDLMKIMADNGVQTARGLDEFSRLTSRRVVLLNTDTINNNMGHTIDSIPGAMTLADMTKACISHLMKHTPDRFFMMIEGGNIDWSGHANDGGTDREGRDQFRRDSAHRV